MESIHAIGTGLKCLYINTYIYTNTHTHVYFSEKSQKKVLQKFSQPWEQERAPKIVSKRKTDFLEIQNNKQLKKKPTKNTATTTTKKKTQHFKTSSRIQLIC